MRRSVWALVVAVPLVLLLVSGFGRDPSAIRSPLVDRAAPGFTLRTLNGRQISLTSLRGRPVVVNFWASWCLSCKDEHRYLREAVQAYAPRGVTFLGIIYQDSASGAQAFLRQRGGGWPALQDPGSHTAIDYGVTGVPETYFIDSHGIVRAMSRGPVTPDLLVRDISPLLGAET